MTVEFVVLEAPAGRTYMVSYPAGLVIVPAQDATKYCEKWGCTVTGDIEIIPKPPEEVYEIDPDADPPEGGSG